MISLLKCEIKKFRGTYINSLSFLGMMSPIILVFLMFSIKKNDFIKMDAYDWENFNSQLTPFFMFLVGPIITSFIAVFSIYYEYQQRTIKNVLSSPHSRTKILLSKIIYVSAFVILQYIFVAMFNILCALVLGFGMSPGSAGLYSLRIIYAGLSTLMLIPLTMLVTLIFKGFIHPMVMTVIGTIANILMLNWEKSYIWPWSIPADIVFISMGNMDMKLIYPVVFASIYFIVFVAANLVYFNRADQLA